MPAFLHRSSVFFQLLEEILYVFACNLSLKSFKNEIWVGNKNVSLPIVDL